MSRTGPVVCTLSLLLFPAIAGGVEFRAADHVIVAVDEVIEGDLYASGETVVIDGVVLGDLVAAGREVTLNGRAAGDFMAAGQVVVIGGTVDDDVRIAGMVLKLGRDATVADHIVSAGYSFEAESGSRVGGAVVFSGAKALLAGDVESAVQVTASAVELGGEIGGNVEAEVSGDSSDTSWFERFFPAPVPIPTVAGGLLVTESARIGGRLSYTAPSEVAIVNGVVDGEVEWDPSQAVRETGIDEGEPPPTFASRAGAQLRRFAALLVFGLVLLWRAPAWADARTRRLAAHPLKSFGWGLAGYVGLPIVALVVLAVTILLTVLTSALSLGRLGVLVFLVGLVLLLVLVVGFVVTTLFAAPVLVSNSAGHALVSRARPERSATRYLPFVLGLVAYVLVSSLPIVGVGVGLFVLILGLGAITQWLLALRPAKS